MLLRWRLLERVAYISEQPVIYSAVEGGSVWGSSAIPLQIHYIGPNFSTNKALGIDSYKTVAGGQLENLKVAREKPWMAEVNQAPFVEWDSSMLSAFKRGPRKEANKSFSGTCEDVSTLCKAGKVKEALHIFTEGGISADSSTYVCLLQECIKIKGLTEGKQVHAHIIQTGFEPNIYVLNTLLNMYAKCGSVVDARLMFDKMPERDVFTWTTMMAGYAKDGCGREALEIYEEMVREGVTPNRVTFICVLKACASLAALEKGIAIHTDIIQAGIVPDIILENTLVDMYAKCSSIKDARRVFDDMAQRNVISWSAMIAGYAQLGYSSEALRLFEQMQEEGLKPNVVSWSAIIAGYAQHGSGREAFEMYKLMMRVGVTPDRVTFVCVLKACASLATLEKGKEVHGDIIKAGIAPDIVLETALADMYIKCGSMKDARQVFDNMARRNVVSWSAMIAGYAQQGCASEALQLFEQMQQEGLKPNVVSWSAIIAGYAQHGYGREAFNTYEQMVREGVSPNRITFVCALKACASLAALEKGKQVHADVIKAGIAPHIILETALADMYAKCGSMKDARQVFDNMARRNVASWNAMIAGYAQHGCGMEALLLFEEMQQEGLKPNGISFICVLSACSHVGLVDEGCHYFDSMSQYYGLTPTVEHFGCIVDLLGRAGRLDVAEDFIDKMPIEPHAAVWGALLGACKIHCNVEVAERAAKALLKWDPEDASTYVLLLNIYAAAGRWDDTAKMRKMMKDRGVREEPGRSSIEVDNHVHTFVVEDESHPQMEEIQTLCRESSFGQ